MEERHLSEQQAVLPAQCCHLSMLHTLRLDCFSEMKAFPLQVLVLKTIAGASATEDYEEQELHL